MQFNNRCCYYFASKNTICVLFARCLLDLQRFIHEIRACIFFFPPFHSYRSTLKLETYSVHVSSNSNYETHCPFIGREKKEMQACFRESFKAVIKGDDSGSWE